MDKIKAIILDMDGVLVDSDPIHERAERETCRQFGINVPKEEADNFRGRRLEEIFSYAREKYGQGDEPIDQMIDRKISLYLEYALRDIELVSGAREFLEQLKNDGRYHYALTTSGRRYQQEKILAKFGLDNFFDIMVTSEDVRNGKPDPEPYAVTVQKLNEQPGGCLVIEDSDNGIRSAKAAGCQVCGFESVFFDRAALTAAGADLVANGFSELEKILFN